MGLEFCEVWIYFHLGEGVFSYNLRLARVGMHALLALAKKDSQRFSARKPRNPLDGHPFPYQTGHNLGVRPQFLNNPMSVMFHYKKRNHTP